MVKDKSIKIRAICSVTEMAKQLGLSRTRFYQLQKTGIFPMPVYCIYTRRPFYSVELQIKCLKIRKTGMGNNGRVILFYAQRKNTPKKTDHSINILHTELSDVLQQMGLNIPPNEIKTALKQIYPEGVPTNMDEGLILRDLFGHFR